MVWSLIIGGFVSLASWVIGMLPTAGCAELTWTSIDVGWAGAWINFPVILVVLGICITFEIGLATFRLAVFIIGLVKP